MNPYYVRWILERKIMRTRGYGWNQRLRCYFRLGTWLKGRTWRHDAVTDAVRHAYDRKYERNVKHFCVIKGMIVKGEKI